MNACVRDVRNVTIGLLTGAVLVLAMGQAPAQDRGGPGAQPALVLRYQITAGRDNAGNEVLFVLDHQTQKVRRAGTNIGADGATVAQLAQIRE
jgi:hypothetical protein